jgi:bifunctional DNA-binding transcriptional regulator/antitoxin component of YhaV-PrlF toxin-antitoxin module
VVVVDRKHRIILDRRVRKVAGVQKGDQLVAIPFKGGVIVVNVTGKSFKGALTGFRFREEEHAASQFLFRRGR